MKQLTQEQEEVVRQAIIGSIRGSFSDTGTPVPDGFNTVAQTIASNVLEAVRRIGREMPDRKTNIYDEPMKNKLKITKEGHVEKFIPRKPTKKKKK